MSLQMLIVLAAVAAIIGFMIWDFVDRKKEDPNAPIIAETPTPAPTPEPLKKVSAVVESRISGGPPLNPNKDPAPGTTIATSDVPGGSRIIGELKTQLDGVGLKAITALLASIIDGDGPAIIAECRQLRDRLADREEAESFFKPLFNHFGMEKKK